MLYIRSAIYTLGLVAFSANAFEGESFQHKDWYLACDNTGTCRAAGYSDTDSLNPVAVMFTREAGPATPVTAKVYLGDESDFDPWPEQINLYIDSQDLGPIKHDILTSMQVQALLAVVTKDSLIEIGDGKSNWVLSGNGASAVFRRMDEYQGRQNTPFAIVAKGQSAESKVIPAADLPTLVNVGGDATMKSLEPESAQYAKLLPQLRATYQNEGDSTECDRLFDESPSISIAKFNNGQSLIEASCWMAAYITMVQATGYWMKANLLFPNSLTSPAMTILMASFLRLTKAEDWGIAGALKAGCLMAKQWFVLTTVLPVYAVALPQEALTQCLSG